MATPWIDLIAPFSAAAAVVLPAAGYVVKRVIAAQVAPIKAALDLHAASDVLIFKNMDEKLGDLKNGQTNQTEKLDRLIERLL